MASGSIRRQEYFKILGLPFSILKADIDESLSKQTDPIKLTVELAVRKAEKAIEMMSKNLPKWICAADTVIACNSKIFGKPHNREEASQMLEQLSGRQHKVVTSVALYSNREKKIDHCTSTCIVTFASLTAEEIEWYLDTNEWQGVAGAYRIQEMASCFITQIKGTPSTVSGLPLREFYVMLRNNGYPYGADNKEQLTENS